MDRWTSRKVLVALLLVALASWMRWAALLSEDGWIQVVRLSIGGYFIANVGQKAVEAVAGFLAAKDQPKA